MSMNLNELAGVSLWALDPRNITECQSLDFKQKLYGCITNLLGNSNTRTDALKKLLSLWVCEQDEELAMLCGKLFPILNKILAKPTESLMNKTLACQCIVPIIKVSLDGGDFQKEVSTSVSSLIKSSLDIDSPAVWVPFLSQIMMSYAGPCGTSKSLIWNKITSLIGEGQVGREALGFLFVRYPHAGGGGKEGIEHTRAFNQVWQVVHNTANSVLNELFRFIQDAEKAELTRELIHLKGMGCAGSIADQTLKFAQFSDLMEIQCSLITSSFPQIREIRCDDIINQVSRILSISSQTLEQSNVPENQVLSLLLPSLHVQAFQALQGLIVGLEDDLLPAVATINNILIKSFEVCTSNKAREALYSTLSVYLEAIGPCSGLEYCLDRIIPFLAQDITPMQDKILLQKSNSNRRGIKKKKSTKHAREEIVGPVYKTSLNIPICRAALNFTGQALQTIGSLISGECFRDISCLLINMALDHQLTDEKVIASICDNLGFLSGVVNPSFNSPIRLSIHALQAATTNPNQEVRKSAKRALASLTPLIHPHCPSMHVPIVSEDDMRKVVAKVLQDQDKKDQMKVAELEAESEPTIFKNSNLSGFLSSSTVSNLHTSPADSQSKESSSAIDNSTVSSSQSQILTALSHSEAVSNSVSKPSIRLEGDQVETSSNVDSLSAKLEADSSSTTSILHNGEQSSMKLRFPSSKASGLKRLLEEATGDDKETDIMESVEQLNSNIKELEERKRVRKESASINEDSTKPAELDVATMLKDFSDQLKDNLIPDPWESD